MKVLKFYTETCTHCKLISPMLEGKAANGEFELEHVDANEHPVLAAKYGIMSVPAVIVIDGEDVSKAVGVMEINKLLG